MSMDPSVAVAMIKAAPGVLGIVVLAAVVVVYRKEFRKLLAGVRSVSAFGVSLTLNDAAVARWTADANRRRSLGVTTGALKAALNRGESAHDAYAGIEILWIDDHPEFNTWERRAIRSLGARVTSAISNAEASELTRRNEYELVISDIGRDNGEDARSEGRRLAASSEAPPIIYYVMDLEPGVPEEAFGITNRPDRLIDLITDALERRYFSNAEGG